MGALKPLLGLVGIFKDEAHCIARTLESVRDHIEKYALIDTGSMDNTREVIKSSLEKISGTLQLQPFVDFGFNRNQALDLEAKSTVPAQFVIMLSADEVLVGGDKLRTFLGAYDGKESCFLVEMQTDVDTALVPRVFRTGSNWRYEGKVHERPVNRVDKVDPSVRIPGVVIKHHVSDPERRMRRVAETDVGLLTAMVRDDKLDLPTRLRAILMLGETYETIASTKDRASPGGEWLYTMFVALSLYARRVEAGGDRDEVEYAKMHFLAVMAQLGLYDDGEMLKRLGEMEKSHLPEVHFMIASHVARLDAKEGYDRAVASARIARDALKNLSMRPINREILWKSHLIAAHCAAAIGRAGDAKKSAMAGIDAGGNPAAFMVFGVEVN